MTPTIESIIKHIAVALNSELTWAEDHAWLIPSQQPATLLTLIWEEETDELILSLSLGTLDERFPPELVMEILESNRIMALGHGPKFSCSPESRMLLLLDTIHVYDGAETLAGELADNLVDIASEVCQRFTALGHHLHTPFQER
ncbi:type III secretion system chaperone [Apirhabdus apintestini]|uniref:type III secretion system chaperone n=1 Tax=Erwinia sp. HR93 TaxID=3094840 RepID=UPI002ADEBA2A|nr:type III secretion system chaperone [Erwinia sp. HR93]MEA1063774.1 type III secretion system chaperone [Erwinia sp. HR93]WPM84159.1 type III secretion system chaperone [Enterobacteriaceae bacterium CA-0114]